MPLGHLAVVTRVINEREVEVDHANWIPGLVGRQVRVLDVSAANDWTAVRVALPKYSHFGAVYGTNGFIYGWPIELGPQIVDIAAALKAVRDDRLQSTSGAVPVVVGPQGVIADKFPEKPMPIVIGGRRETR